VVFNDPGFDDKKICMHFADNRGRFKGAVIPPIFGNTLFTYSSFESLAEADSDETDHYVYMRGKNPTVEIAEKKLAALEQGELCVCFASGMAAISAALTNSVKSGDHVLCISNIYVSTKDLLIYLEKFQVSHSIVFSTDLKESEKQLKPNTRVIH
jgi:cystathionine beta-lyase/cystathionine gamma-synthase